MESYNFDEIVSRRGTDCAKWDAVSLLFGEEDVIPMWVADMDLPVAKPIIEALKKRLEHELFGYAMPMTDTLAEVFIERMKRKYNWEVEPEWLVPTPGVIPALNHAVEAFTRTGDTVIHQSPIYHHFWKAIERAGCQKAVNELKLENGRYAIDFDDLNSKFESKPDLIPTEHRARMMLICNPHNPVGRVWKIDELQRMGEIAIGNGAVVLSNEIHCELLYKGIVHTPFASISKEFEQNSIVCMAPSKTFNIAGLGASMIIIPNPELRATFEQAKKNIMPHMNVMGMVAMEAAYKNGDPWLEQVLDYLQGNYDTLAALSESYLPGIKIIKPEGTYLIWLDCRDLGMSTIELADFMFHKAKVGIEPGYMFGSGGDGFVRMNIACARPLLIEALTRIKNALNKYSKP